MRTSLLLLVVLAGCAGAEKFDAKAQAEVPEGDEGLDQLDALRLDVLPPLELANADGDPVGDLTQSFPFDPTRKARLLLNDTVDVSGVIEGYVVSPWLSAELPGTQMPIEALVSLVRPGTIQAYNTLSDASTGAFDLSVVAGSGYQVAIVPEDAGVPFLVDTVDINRSRDLSGDLGTGAAVWGFVLDSNGAGIADVALRAVDAATGVTSAPLLTDRDGRYVLRVLPDRRYRVEALGRTSGRDPHLATEAARVRDSGLQADFVYANLDHRNVGGRITVEGDTTLDDVGLRFTAMSLEGYGEDATMVVEDDTDSNGNFDVRLLAGTWTMEVLPTPEQPFSPVAVGPITVGDVDRVLPNVVLTGLVDIAGTILDPFESVVDNALLTCVEIGFRGRFYEQLSTDGSYALTVPGVPLECTMSPPGGRTDMALTRTVIDPLQGGTDLVYELGEFVAGQVRYDGQGVPFAVVEVRDGRDELWGAAVTDETGEWTLRIANTESR